MGFATWRETVTVYHRLVGLDGTVTWTATVYQGCFWGDKHSRSSNQGAARDSATRLSRIPGSPLVLTGDIVVHGAVRDEIDEYTAGSRSTDLRKRYPESFTVTQVHLNGWPGRPLTHIYVEGA